MSAAVLRKEGRFVRLPLSASSRVKLLRLRMQLTQAKFGAIIGVAGSTVCAWERERSHPSRLARIRLAEYEQGKLKKPVLITWVYD